MVGTSAPAAWASWLRRHALLLWSALICALVLAPLAAPGYVLSYDMVAVPDQALTPTAMGLSSALPRAVPLDAVVAVVDNVIPGALLQRIVLGAVVLGATLGAGLAVPGPGTRLGARLVAASTYGWNAYVFERLVIGHWPTLIAYAALPWLLITARRVRLGRPGAVGAGVLLTGVASLTATGGLIAMALFAAVVLAPGGVHGRRTRLTCVVAALAVQLPWLAPGVLRPGPAVSDPAGVAAFAAQSDSPLGLLGSLATLGGVWNEAAVPDSRALASSAILSVLLLLLAGAGVRELRRRLGPPEFTALAGLAGVGLVLALLGAIPGGRVLAEQLVAHVPGAGLIRDGQKFLAWYALLLALACGVGAARVASAIRGRAPSLAVTAMAVVLPLAALPDLAWGAAGRLTPVEYPTDWAEARTVLRAADARGDLVVLPFQPFRAFPWTDGRTVLDPAPRYLGVETVLPDALPVGGEVIEGEDERAARVEAALRADDPMDALAAVGVGWIAVQRDTPGEIPDHVTRAAEPVLQGETLDLYRVPNPTRAWDRIPSTTAVIAAGIISLAILLVASADLVRKACFRRSRSIRS